MFEVTFDIDTNGIVNVSAADKSTRGRCRRDHRPYESNPSKRGLLMTTLAPEFKGGIWVTQGRSHPGLAGKLPKPTEPPNKSSLQSRIHVILEEEDQEKKEEDSPSFGSCRPLSRVADSGPKSKVKYPLISALLSLMIYPCMCGHTLEPNSRPGLRPVNASGVSPNTSVHTLDEDPDVRREGPRLGSAVDSGLVRLPSALSRSLLGSYKLQQALSTS